MIDLVGRAHQGEMTLTLEPWKKAVRRRACMIPRFAHLVLQY